jgi:hypothetical protein
MFTKQIQPFTAAGRGDHLIPMPHKNGLKEIAVHLVIVDD